MARHRATRPSVASVMSTTSANGTRTRTKLSYEQNALLALAENSLKRNKKPLNVSAIVKDAERRAHEQGLELGIRARPRIKKAVEKLAEQGAIAEAPRKGRTPAEYRLTPKAVKVYNDAKSHRRSDVGIAKETLDTLKDDVERPNKRRRSSVSAAAASPPRPVQQATITKLKAELTAARSEIASLKKSNEELLDQQLDDDDDDIFDFPPNADTSRVTDRSARPSFPATHGLSFLGGRPTRPTTPELTENGSPEYDAPGEFDFDAGMTREMTPPSSSPPDTLGPRRIHEQTALQKSEIELKMERLETSMAELALEKAQMAEEIAALKNQVEHERQNAIHLAEVRHEADLVRVELAQANKEVLLLTHNNAALEGQCVDLSGAKKQLDITVSQLNADLNARITSESEAQTSLINTTRELEATKSRLMLAQDDARRTSESLAIADNAVALMTDNLAARDSTITELRDLRDLTNEQLQTLRGENQTLRDNLAFAGDRASSAELMINERELEIFGLKTKQAGLQGHITQLVSENTELLAQIEAMKANAERDLMKIAELDSQIEGLNAQVDSLHGELDAIRFDKDQLQARAEADSATAGRFIAQRDATIAERDMQVAKLGADLKGKSQELFERQKQIGQLQVALAESANETKSLRSSQKATETELATSIKTIEERNGAIADLRTKDQASTKRIGELKSDLAKHKEAIEEHQDVISKLELQLERLRDIEHESLRRRRARIQAEAKRLRDEEADLTRETIDVDQWDEGLSQSRAARASLAPSWGVSPSPE